jgi:hypothetical protein
VTTEDLIDEIAVIKEELSHLEGKG